MGDATEERPGFWAVQAGTSGRSRRLPENQGVFSAKLLRDPGDRRGREFRENDLASIIVLPNKTETSPCVWLPYYFASFLASLLQMNRWQIIQ